MLWFKVLSIVSMQKPMDFFKAMASVSLDVAWWCSLNSSTVLIAAHLTWKSASSSLKPDHLSTLSNCWMIDQESILSIIWMEFVSGIWIALELMWRSPSQHQNVVVLSTHTQDALQLGLQVLHIEILIKSAKEGILPLNVVS